MASAYKSIRLFKNPILEAFSHIPPWLPITVWGPVVLFFAYRTVFVLALPPLQGLSLALGGLLFWTLSEYLLHRFLFHFEAAGKMGKKFIYILHGIHHDDAQDPTRLVFPPLAGAIFAVSFYALFSLVLGPLSCQPFFAAFVAGYLLYDYTHYATHHWIMANPWAKMIKKNHMNHHFKDHDCKWGVSTPFWDYVFGTFEPPAKKS